VYNVNAPIDAKIVRALILHRLRAHYPHHSSNDDLGCADLAALYAVSEHVDRAQKANVTVEMSFTSGVEFGIDLAIAAIDNPFMESSAFDRAIDLVKKELTRATESAIEDAQRTPAA
jgi:hypothetical protein